MDELRPEGAKRYGDDDGRVTPWEARVAVLAGDFAYPPTPNLTVAARRAGLARFVLSQAWAVALLVVVIVTALLAVPQVRAAVVRVFQLGVVRIFVTEPSSRWHRSSTFADSTGNEPGQQGPVTATPIIGPPLTALPGIAKAQETPQAGTAGVPPSLAGLAGRTTLEEAQRSVPFPIALPGYPADLGPPDYAFVQHHKAPVLILAWSDPAAKGGVGLSLWTFLNGSVIEKFQPRIVQETTVDGERALWTEGEHVLLMRNGDIQGRTVGVGEHTHLGAEGSDLPARDLPAARRSGEGGGIGPVKVVRTRAPGA